MSHHDEDEHDLRPTFVAGYKVGTKKTAEELAALDAEDESLAKWKASLGIVAPSDGSAPVPASGPQVTVLSLFLKSPTLKDDLTLNLTNAAGVASLKQHPITIKEGVNYSVGITFKVNHGLTSGLRYIQIVKRAGVRVDKLDQMLGSFASVSDINTTVFPEEESPSGMLARSGFYIVRSRVIDDDSQVYIDFEWSFKLSKDW